MKKLSISIFLSLTYFLSQAQSIDVGFFSGVAAYNGDLSDKLFPKHFTKPAIGITGSYFLNSQMAVRAGYTYGSVGGADRYSEKQDLINRNLSFQTRIHEFSLVGEYYLMDMDISKFSPYLFGGIAVYNYKPYDYDVSKNKVFLQPLSTEGQGLPGYSLKPYKLTQLSIPFGGGIKYAINDKVRLGLEFGLRKLFTDYFDDVSGGYANRYELLVGRGQTALDMSYRNDELPGGNLNYPVKGTQRGNPKSKDWYYFTGLHLSIRIHEYDNSGGRIGGKRGGGLSGKKTRMGCPTNIF